MKCPNCQFENPEGAKFCIECGNNLGTPPKKISEILSFDEKLDKIQRYLPKGLVERVLSQRDKIEGEWRQVTILFCDMKGFTPLTEKLGPEQTFSLMDQVFEILIHIVHEHEGTVNELRGDGVLALFGAPIALEDAPQRAIRAAIAIHQEMTRFNEKLRVDSESEIPSIVLRIGINTGPVVVGSVGNDLRVQFTAMGDTINLASRMEELAEPGTTYITKETFQLNKGLFRFEALGEKAVKGKEKAVPVYKVLSEEEDIYRPRLGYERMIYADMVGRDRDLDRVELQVSKAIKGDGSVVNIMGEAGIGKSRLVAELKKLDVMKRVTFLEGRAISIGRNLSYHPITEFLKQWARIGKGDGEAAALGKLETAVKEVCQEDVYEVLPFVATLMGMKLSGRYGERVKGIEGEALEKLIRKSMRDLLIKATELTPLVIVMEDLHWADTTTIELMESLFPLTETQRILFVNLFRPGHKEMGERFVENIRRRLPDYYVEIALEPLDDNMSETLITSMLIIREPHHAFIDQVVQRAGGNPFFIEEVVRSTIDERAVVLKQGSFEATDKIHAMTIPHTINDVLMARIDRLDEKTRSLLKIASVIGRNFFHRILIEVAGGIGQMDNRLSHLKKIQLIREGRRMGEAEYCFTHALAQEVIYESILLQKRRELHLKVADSIEKLFSERLQEFYGILSHHYSNGEDLDRAEEYMLKTGEEAMKSSASHEALHYFKRAMELYIKKCGDVVDSNKIADLEESIATAFFNKGYFAEAVDYFDRSLKSRGENIQGNKIIVIIKLIIDLLSIIRILYLPQIRKKKIPSNLDNQIMARKLKMGVALAYVDVKRMFVDYIGTAKQILKLDVSKSQICFDVLAGASALFSVTGISFNISGKILDYSKKALLSQDEKASLSLHFFTFMDSIHNCLVGKWDNELDEDLIYSALKKGDVSFASSGLVWLAYMKIERGDFDKTEKIAKILNSISDEYGFVYAKLDFFYLNAKLLMKRRDPCEGLKFANEGITLLDEIDLDMRRVEILSMKSRLLILQNDLEGSEKILEEAQNIILKIGKHTILTNYYSDYLMGIFSCNLARLENSVVSNDKQSIFEFSRAALKSGKMATKHCRKRVAADRTEALNLMGRYYWLVNNQEKALKWWEVAIKEGERLGARPELSRTYFEVGKRLNEMKSEYKELNGINADEYLERARIMFEEMELKRDLEEFGDLP